MPTISNEAFRLDDIELPSDFPYRAYQLEKNWELLTDLGEQIAAPRGTMLHATSHTPYCYLVQSGLVSSSNPAKDNLPRHGAFFLQGSLFLESNALSGLPSDATFTAQEDSVLIRIDPQRLKAAMMDNGDVFDLVIGSLAHKFFSANERLRETERDDVRMRVYLMLLGFARDSNDCVGGGWHRISFKLTQQMIGEMLGANRVTVNTAIRSLGENGVVEKRGGRYCVHDPKGLIS